MTMRQDASKYYAPNINSGELTVVGKIKELFVVVSTKHSEQWKDVVICHFVLGSGSKSQVKIYHCIACHAVSSNSRMVWILSSQLSIRCGRDDDVGP